MKKDNKGFTMLEMLIVVAIISVLFAIALPVFRDELKTAKKRADEATVKVAYLEAMADMVEDGEKGVGTSRPLQSNNEELDLPDGKGETFASVKGAKVKLTVNPLGQITDTELVN